MSETIQIVEGVGPVVSNVSQITPGLIKDAYLTGLNFVDANKQPYPSSWYVTHINSAIAKFERHTQIHVLRRVIVDELHDYNANDYVNFCFFSLFNYPVISVERVAAMYPTGQLVFTFPVEWVRLNTVHGQVQLVPTQGSLSSVLLGRGGSYLPLIYAGMGYLPQLFHVDYTSGFAEGMVPLDIVDAICKLAVIQMLAVAGDTVFPPGVTNISAGIDGVSQGIGILNNGQLPPVFAGRISTYRAELYGRATGPEGEGVLDQLRSQYKGLNLRVA